MPWPKKHASRNTFTKVEYIRNTNEFNMGNLHHRYWTNKTRMSKKKHKLWCLVIRCARAMCWAFAFLLLFFLLLFDRVMKKYCVCGDQEMNLCNICALLLLFLFVGFFSIVSSLVSKFSFWFFFPLVGFSLFQVHVWND